MQFLTGLAANLHRKPWRAIGSKGRLIWDRIKIKSASKSSRRGRDLIPRRRRCSRAFASEPYRHVKKSKYRLRDPALSVIVQDHATYPSTFLTYLYIHIRRVKPHSRGGQIIPILTFALPFMEELEGLEYLMLWLWKGFFHVPRESDWNVPSHSSCTFSYAWKFSVRPRTFSTYICT